MRGRKRKPESGTFVRNEQNFSERRVFA